jgi:hypothetical protein
LDFLISLIYIIKSETPNKTRKIKKKLPSHFIILRNRFCDPSSGIFRELRVEWSLKTR